MSQDLLDLLERSASGNGTVRFLPHHPVPIPMADLWHSTGAAANGLSRRTEEGATVAMMLTASPACLASIVGAWRAGLTVASMPMRARGQSPEEHAATLNTLIDACGASLLLSDSRYGPIDGVSAPQLSFEAVPCGGPGGRPAAEPGTLIQCSSGSTGNPKGIRLPLDRIAANIKAIGAAYELDAGDICCSWLPMSHDMGLIGTCLSLWSVPGCSIVFIDTEAFASRPSIWMQTCSEMRATVSASANLGLDVASRFLARARDVSLSRMRAIVVGGEPPRAGVLRRFEEAASRVGLPSNVLCPSYGMAEAVLAVTATRPGSPWQTQLVDPVALADGRWSPVDSAEGGLEVVSSGTPLDGVEVRLRNGPVGEVLVDSPSLFEAYLDRPAERVDGRWHPTDDVGYIDPSGNVYVGGRQDDVISVRGRNLFALDLERRAAAYGVVRSEGCAVVPDAHGGYVVIAECRRGNKDDRTETASQIRQELVRATGVGPSRVLFIPPGSFPKTPSGKLQRRRLHALMLGNALAVDDDVSFVGASAR